MNFKGKELNEEIEKLIKQYGIEETKQMLESAIRTIDKMIEE